MRLQVLKVALLVFTSLIAVAEASEWAIAIGSSDCDAARSIHQTKDGGYVVAGYTTLLAPMAAGELGF